MKRYFFVPVLAAGVLMLTAACTPVGVAAGAGATLGIAAAQEGGVRAAAADAAIRLQITDLWIKQGFDLYRRLDMTVKEGRVLITGSVANADQRVEAVRLAWQADGVRQVINEISVNGSTGITGYVTDTWVTGNLSTRLMLDKFVQSINYNVDTVGGTVYLMGIAQDQRELDRVIDHARNAKYVKNVVSYVRLRGETPAGVQAPTSKSAVATDWSAPAADNWQDTAPVVRKQDAVVESVPLDAPAGSR